MQTILKYKICQHCFFLPERHLRFVFYKHVGYKFTGCIINIFSYSSHVIKSGIATTTFVFMSLALLDQMFLIHRTDDDGVRGFVTAVQVEKWKNFFSEGILKGVNMGPCSHIIKRHLAFFVVHIHAHSLGLRVEGEQWWWGCWRSVSLAFLHGQSPIALGGAYRDPALSVNRWPRHTKVPVILFPHLDLPVVSARSEALMGQYYNHRVEAIGVVREVLPGTQVSHLMSILRELQPRVSCVRVKSHIHCRRTRQRIYFIGEFNDENTGKKNK